MYNPISGAGRSAAAAESLARTLPKHGHEARTVASVLEPTARWLDPVLADSDVLVVAGGDGAMRLAAPAACRTNTPVYHLPFGTENLFAREFGMNASPDRLLRAIERHQIRRVDVGVANGRWFLLMVSVGFDAEVVHTLALSRGQSISRLTYVKPILGTMRNWTPPTLQIEVDGERLISNEQGMVVIANSRQYGWRIDPAGQADMSDGLLDVVFLPAQSLIAVIGWAWRCRTRRQFRNQRLKFARGKRVVVRSDRLQHFQLDGDPPGVVHEMLPAGLEALGHERTEDETNRPLILNVGICPDLLPVLMPV